MGNSSGTPTGETSVVYSVSTKSKDTPPNCTEVFRAATHPDELVEALKDGSGPVICGWDVFQHGIRAGGRGAGFLGTRKKKADGTFGSYEWINYGEVETQARSLGSEIKTQNLVTSVKFHDELYEGAKSLKVVGIFMKNRAEWIITEQACNGYGYTLVPLYDSLSADAIAFIMKETEMHAMVCSDDCADILLSALAENPGCYLKNLILVDDERLNEIKTRAGDLGLSVFRWSDLLESGRKNLLPLQPGNPAEINTISYTSGTTGNPKGVLLTHRNFVSVLCAAMRGPTVDPALTFSPTDRHMSYLPLAHVFERVFASFTVFSGGRIGFFTGDITRLLADVQELRPTFFISVPRLYNRINDKVNAGLTQKSGIARALFNYGLSTKISLQQKNGQCTHTLWDKLVFSKTKALLGGRVRWMATGGAPIDPPIISRMRALFCVPMVEGYGMTETMAGTFLTSPHELSLGTIGGVLPCCEFALQSIPEMNYSVNDPTPGGELLIRGPTVSPGYFRNAAGTAETRDGEWLHTGDVVRLTNTGAVRIVDRKKNIFKLAQGEYVAPERIEATYLRSALIAQIFAYGDSTKAQLVGITVPDEDAGRRWLSSKDLKVPEAPADVLAACAANPDFQRDVVQDMGRMDSELKGFEKIKLVYVHNELFSVENGLLTPTFKLKRHPATQMFQPQIKSLYANCPQRLATNL